MDRAARKVPWGLLPDFACRSHQPDHLKHQNEADPKISWLTKKNPEPFLENSIERLLLFTGREQRGNRMKKLYVTECQI